MNKYRRIEVNAFRRRVTIVSGVSGEWPGEIPLDIVVAQPAQTDDDVLLDDSDSCEPVAPDSPEGQLLLMEAMDALERRLSPVARAAIHSDQDTLSPNRPHRNGLCLKLHSFYHLICTKALHFARKEK